jgi:hypothetical protein
VRALGHWFGRTNQLCVGKARGDGLVRVEMEDVSNTMAKTAERYQLELQQIHGILKMVVTHISRSKNGAESSDHGTLQEDGR